jgi:drug/metabolite transporter (DMT)-like permease
LPALALVAASAAWAGGTVLAGKRSHGDAMRGAAVQLLTGALLLLPISIVRGEIGMLARTPATSSSLVALGYLVVFGSLIGYTAYSWLLHQVPASKVASHSYVNPLVAVIVGALLAREQITAYTLVAAALIIVSVVVIITERGRDGDSQGPAALARPQVLSSLRPKRSSRTLELARQSHEIAPVRRVSGDHHQPERSGGAVRTA